MNENSVIRKFLTKILRTKLMRITVLIRDKVSKTACMCMIGLHQLEMTQLNIYNRKHTLRSILEVWF